MAKIQPGPLAATISGSIGNITFAPTKFGQIVQRKPVPPYPGSPAQQAQIQRFRLAVNAFWRLSWIFRAPFLTWAKANQQNPAQAWISTFIQLHRLNYWSTPVRTIDTPAVQITNLYEAGGFWHFETNLDYLDTYFMRFIAIKDGVLSSPNWDGHESIRLKIPPVGWGNPPPEPPFWVIGMVHIEYPETPQGYAPQASYFKS